MALIQSKRVAARLPATESDGAGDLVVQLSELVIATGNLALNNVLEMCILPANHVLLDVIVYLDDLDSNGTPLLSFDYGVLSGRAGDGTDQARTCSNAIGAGDTTGRAGGIFRMNKVPASFLSSTSDVGIGIKVAAAAATAVVGAKIRMAITYVAETGLNLAT